MQRISMSVVCGLLAGACAAEDAAQSTSANAITLDNKLASNKLASNKLASNKLASNKLASNKLAANRLAAAELLATPDGREVLKVLVSCALPEGVTLVGEAGGVSYELPGQVGLAPGWLHHPLDRADKGWVSACVFARVNAHDVSVLVSLRGSHRALEVGAEEEATWTLEEGAFYGNLFTAEGEPIDWHACRGSGQAAGEDGDLVNRDCTEPDPARPGLTQCGFQFAGDCGRFARPRACRGFSRSGTYRNCAEAPIFGDHDEGDSDNSDERLFRQVITTYVRP